MKYLRGPVFETRGIHTVCYLLVVDGCTSDANIAMSVIPPTVYLFSRYDDIRLNVVLS